MSGKVEIENANVRNKARYSRQHARVFGWSFRIVQANWIAFC
jgi:hypothetical protein